MKIHIFATGIICILIAGLYGRIQSASSTPEMVSSTIKHVDAPVLTSSRLNTKKQSSESYITLTPDPASAIVVSADSLADIITPMAEQYIQWIVDEPNDIPEGDWLVYRFFSSGVPSGPYVTGVEVHHEITHTYTGDIEVVVFNELTSHEWLVREATGYPGVNINETVTEEMLFDDDDPSQDWYYAIGDWATYDQGTLDLLQFRVYFDTNASGQADLTPYQPVLAETGFNWNDEIPVGTVQLAGDTNHSETGPYYTDDTLYVNFASLNLGVATAANYTIYFEVTGTGGGSLELPGVTTGSYGFTYLATDYPIGPLGAGNHTLKLWVDYDDDVNESDETNNYYERTITVHAPASAEIHGMKFNDLDGDGAKDGDEPGLENWKIYLDLNSSGEWDPDEPSTLTAADGSYAFTGLLEGTYIVGEVQQAGWDQTYPSTLMAMSASAVPGPTTRGDELSEEELAKIEFTIMDSPPHPPVAIQPSIVTASGDGVVILDQVPTSYWTYGCTATSAGMLFGYYDRTGYSDMYTGPTNGGVAPLTNLGQGDDVEDPISGACSIIATQNGFDGRTTNGHVDDYWIDYNSSGPDPFEGNWTEHTWGDCTADYLGTNQWKWDFDSDEEIDNNTDGSTIVWNYGDGQKLYDYVQPTSYGMPPTACCHGLRLFAESRGYTVVENYNQLIYPYEDNTTGFSFDDYMAQIDAGRPVLIHVEGHTMIGVGYDDSTQTVYLHNTWGNYVDTMTWGGYYGTNPPMQHYAVTVIELESAPVIQPPGTHQVTLGSGEVVANINFGNHEPTCGDWGYLPADADQNCIVDVLDYQVLASQWLETGCAATNNCYGADMDVDGSGPDGVVDIRDFARLYMDWLLCTDPGDPEQCVNLTL